MALFRSGVKNYVIETKTSYAGYHYADMGNYAVYPLEVDFGKEVIGIIEAYSNSSSKNLVASGEYNPGISNKRLIISGTKVILNYVTFASPSNNVPFTVTALVKI